MGQEVIASSNIERNEKSAETIVIPQIRPVQMATVNSEEQSYLCQVEKDYNKTVENREKNRLRKERNRIVHSIRDHADTILKEKSPETKEFVQRVLHQFSNVKKLNAEEQDVQERRTALFSKLMNLKRYKDMGKRYRQEFRFYKRQILEGRTVADVAAELQINSRPLHDLFRIKERKTISHTKVTDEEITEIDETTRHSNITQPSAEVSFVLIFFLFYVLLYL